MKVLEVKYLFRKNEGNYQHSEIGMTAAPEEGELPQDVLAQLKKLVHEEAQEQPVPESIVAEMPEAKSDEPQVTHSEVEEVKPKRGRKPKAKEEEQVAPPPAKVKKAGTVYSRENDLHKKLVGELLNKEFPGWKNNPKKAKEASVALEGTEFLDSEGVLLESFKEQLRDKMK